MLQIRALLFFVVEKAEKFCRPYTNVAALVAKGKDDGAQDFDIAYRKLGLLCQNIRQHIEAGFLSNYTFYTITALNGMLDKHGRPRVVDHQIFQSALANLSQFVFS